MPLLVAILVRCGTVPAHCWVTDWFEHASLGIALLFVLPLLGVYAAIRLVLPIGPGWVLQSIGLLVAGHGRLCRRDGDRSARDPAVFCHLFLSLSSLVFVGLELHTELSLTASLCLWFSVILSLGGFGLTLLHSNSLRPAFAYGLPRPLRAPPTLAVCFLLTGLASVGFPGTLGFISTDYSSIAPSRPSLHRHRCYRAGT